MEEINDDNKFICAICGKKFDYEIEEVVNPYVEEIQGIKIYERICDECYNMLIKEI